MNGYRITQLDAEAQSQKESKNCSVVHQKYLS
jgi:hypothetical protein